VRAFCGLIGLSFGRELSSVDLPHRNMETTSSYSLLDEVPTSFDFESPLSDQASSALSDRQEGNMS
jgi:hypothetical protein